MVGWGPRRYLAALVAGAAWLLIGEGELDVSKQVVDYFPEFGANGKDVITVDQVLQHTSGFPHAPLAPVAGDTSAGRVAAFGEWRLNWEPGRHYEYHPTSAHWVLAEIIDRITGSDYRRFIHERIALPLDLPTLRVGVPLDEQQDIAELEVRGEPPSPDELEAVLGIRQLDVGEVTDENLLQLNRPDTRAIGVPGGGGIMTAADLALYYQALLHDRGNVWDAAVRDDVTSVVRTGDFVDPVRGAVALRTRGLMLAGADGHGPRRGFGRRQSPRAFGHDGAGGQVAWADPESGLSFAYVTNGLDAHILRMARRSVSMSDLASALSQT
jgi:CubicO group peptidase (beta-lactamase class C family)